MLPALAWRRVPGASDRRQGLISDPLHHCFKVVAHLARELQPFDGRRRAQQRQYANVIRRQRAADGVRAFDQSIQLLEIGKKIADVATRIGPQFDEVTNRFALAQIVVVDGRDRCEFRQPSRG